MKSLKLQSKTQKWQVKRLNEVCEVNPNAILNQSDGTVEYVEMAVIDENLKEIKYFLDRPINKVSSGTPKFMNNDVIFARITPCTENGKVAFVENCDGVCAGSTELHVLRAKQEVLLPRFLFYLLIRPEIKDMAVASMSGTTGRQRVPAEFFHYLKIPLPSLPVQKSIVERLDAIRKAQELNDKQIALAEELFQSLLHRELDPEGNDWEVKRLKDLFARQNEAIVPAKQYPEDYFNYIGLEDIESNSGELINFSDTIGKNIKSSKFRFRKEDVLYGKLRPYLNKVWLAEFDGICSTDIWVLRSNSDYVLPLILMAILRSRQILQRASSSMIGSNLPRVSKDYFDSIKIGIPPLETQYIIVQKLQAVQNYKKSLLTQKEKLKELFESTLDKA